MEPSPDWFENDDLFRSEMGKGHEFALRVGTRLLSEGFAVQVTKPTFRENIKDRHEYADEVDLRVNDIPIEVKSRSLVFSNPEDYPFPTAFIDTKNGWDRKVTTPAAVVLVSQKTGAMLVVPVSTRPRWTAATRRDHIRNIYDTWLEVDRNLLLPFESLIEWLSEHEQQA